MLPTYKRVNSLKTIVDSARDTVSNIDNIRWSFCVNENDKETVEFIKSYLDNCQYNIILENTRQPNLSKYFNLMYDAPENQDLEVVSELGDDMVFRTKGWDQRILEELNKHKGLVIVYCNDDYIAHEKCCVNLFTTRKLVKLTQKPFMCPLFHADMMDMVWTMAGGITGLLSYLDDVIIFHNHNRQKKKDDWDETYKRIAPVQFTANSGENRRLALAYATLMAKNLIESGVGQWNTLQ